MQYNLLRNGSLQAITNSGTGNVNLTWSQLETLIDQVTDQGGVSLSPSEILYLDGDLTQRIKIDGIYLYHTGLPASNVKFYYKNEAGESYTLRPTSSGAGYLYTTLPSPSAPRWIRCVVSGVSAQIHEFQIFNDDYIVAFGQDGQLYAEYLGDTPEGSISDVKAVPVYNNGTSTTPVDAYVCVDHQGTEADYYIEISTSQNGPFKSLDDGAFIEDDGVSSTWRWSDGELNGLEVSGDSLVIGTGGSLGEVASEIPFENMPTHTYQLRTGDNTMAYDRVNKKMYIMGLDDAQLKVWEYLYETDEWDYICTINYTQNDALYHWPVMTYCSVSGVGRIYVSTKMSGDDIYFGYHELGGSFNNWTPITSIDTLASYGWSPSIYSALGMCSDGERFIYCSFAHRDNVTWKFFVRYDTISGTWSDLDDGYDNNTGTPTVITFSCLTYDYDRDRIYALSTTPGRWDDAYAKRYIQMYDVATDVWTNKYISWESIARTSPYVRAGICYCDDYLYMSPNYGWTDANIYRWKLPTLERETMPFGYKHYDVDYNNTVGFPILAINPYNTDDHKIYVTSLVNANDTNLYKYDASAGRKYTSPIFKLTSDMNSSFWVVDGTTESGTSSISYDPDVYNGTIRVRSHNNTPLTIDEFYISHSDGDVAKWIPYNSYWDTSHVNVSNSSQSTYGCAVDRRSGNIAVSRRFRSGASGDTSTYISLYDRGGTHILTKSWSSIGGLDYHALAFNRWFDFDKYNGIWGSGDETEWRGAAGSRQVLHLDSNLDVLYYRYESGADFVKGLAPERDGDGCWYSSSVDEALFHIDSLGNTLQEIPLEDPRYVAATPDNGCWVAEYGDNVLIKYDSDGTLVRRVSVGVDVEYLTDDYEGGCWYLYNNRVYHVNGNTGAVDVGPIIVMHADRITGCRTGVYVYSFSNNFVSFISRSTGLVETTQSWTFSESRPQPFAVLSYNYDDYAELKTSEIIFPASYDPVWSNLEWTEVVKDGYFLPKVLYHQVELTLRGTGGSIDKLLMAPAVNLQDINPGQYKNVYVRANIPLGADITEYETKLRAWWGLEE